MRPASPSRRSAGRVNIAERLVDRRLAEGPDAPVIRFPGGEWTLEALAERVGRLAGVLLDRGVQRGDRVALALPDSPAWVSAFLAITRVGAVAAPVPASLPADRIADGIRRAAPALVVTNDRGIAGLDCLCPNDLDPRDGSDPGPAPTTGMDPAYMLLTSGSTGPPKWAIHRHQDILFCLATYGRHVLRLRPGDVTYSTASLATSYGLGNSLYFPLGTGACAWIDGAPPTPPRTADACVQGGVTAMFGVPTFWARIARHVADGRLLREAFAGIRLAVSAGEPLPVTVFDAVRREIGIELVDGLGSSEATNLFISNRPGRAMRGTVGFVVPGFEVRVCDPSGRRVTAGEPGELLVRGGSIMAGYFNDDVSTARALDGGWLHTGDVVRRDERGAYRFVRRVGDHFKAGGLWVDPNRVGAALSGHPGVAELAALGVADGQGVTRVIAVVAPAPGVDAAELERDLTGVAESFLAPHERPRAFVVVDELPTTPSGKIRRDAVARLARQLMEKGSIIGVER